MSRSLTLLALAVLLAASCEASEPTAQFPGEPPTTATTATTAPPTTQAASDCPQAVVECPRSEVTPGAVIASTDGVCQASYNPRKELSSADKRRILAAYGLPADTKVAEWDHLVARWAGGRSDPSDMWPAVDAAQARRKDALEESLYLAVCKRKTLTLAAARDRMRRFWAWWPARQPATTTTSIATTRSVYYANCAAARAAGAAPLHRGEPGYRPALDRDGDGVACE